MTIKSPPPLPRDVPENLRVYLKGLERRLAEVGDAVEGLEQTGGLAPSVSGSTLLGSFIFDNTAAPFNTAEDHQPTNKLVYDGADKPLYRVYEIELCALKTAAATDIHVNIGFQETGISTAAQYYFIEDRRDETVGWTPAWGAAQTAFNVVVAENPSIYGVSGSIIIVGMHDPVLPTYLESRITVHTNATPIVTYIETKGHFANQVIWTAADGPINQFRVATAGGGAPDFNGGALCIYGRGELGA